MLSVIIPTQNDERVLAPTLAALVSGAIDGLVSEVILADRGSQDATLTIADAAGCVLIEAPADGEIPSVGKALAEAAARARGTWLMFLRPGFIPEPHWAGEVRRFIESAAREGAPGRAAAFRAGEQQPYGMSIGQEIARLFGRLVTRRVGPAQGLLIARAVYDAAGGHRADVADAEADLIRRIGRRRIALLACGGTLPP